MAHDSQLPCDGNGICMLCRAKPSDEEKLTCNTCTTPWHVSCLAVPPQTLASTLQWNCPDCSAISADVPTVPVGKSVLVGVSENSGELIAAIRAIEADGSLTEREKAKRRQELMSGGVLSEDKKAKKKQKVHAGNDVLDLLDGSLNCSFCMQVPERPVTTPCGHNFCLKCFQKWVGQGKRTCAKCRRTIPSKMASQPRINSTLVVAIRMAKMSKSIISGGQPKVYHFLHNQNRPDKAFTTERAQRNGKANAASGKVFVTVPPDYFGPILAENDPERRQGVLVGECWADRLECRQWGAHLPHISGIAGQSKHGAQSVVLSGGYQDDEDHGEWFLYTGSGGRDLSGNKRTNKKHSFDQKFTHYNEALRLSCQKGYPVRVVRSHKEKRSSYAPDRGLRYDGIYRVEKCWRKVGKPGYKVCRYLFVRCDNDPAPWTSDENGDRPRPLPVIPELKQATDIAERKESPSWDYDEEESCWKWKRPQPPSKKPVDTGNSEDRTRAKREIREAQNMSIRQKLLKEFSCLICREVMTLPVTTPCGHNFCKACLEGAFAGQSFVRERTCRGGRTLRAQKNVLKCPFCPTDISDFLQNPQVNRELKDVIESLQRKTEEIEDTVDGSSDEEADGGTDEEPDVKYGAAEISTEADDGTDEEPDVKNRAAEISTENSEKVSVNDDLQNPETNCKPKRTCKQKEVEVGDCSLKIDDVKESKVSAEGEAGVKGVTEADKLSLGMLEGDNKDFQVPGVTSFTAQASNKKKAGGGGRASKPDAVAKTRKRKAQEAVVDEGNNSPSSPLHVRSEDDDFE